MVKEYRFKTLEEFTADGLMEINEDWGGKNVPVRWNSEGEMNYLMGKSIQLMDCDNLDGVEELYVARYGDKNENPIPAYSSSSGFIRHWIVSVDRDVLEEELIEF